MFLRFGRRRQRRQQQPEEEPQVPPPDPEATPEAAGSPEPAEAADTSEPAEAGETTAVSDQPPPAESTAIIESQEAPAESKEHTSPTFPSATLGDRDSVSLLNTLLRVHEAEDIAALTSAADQLVRAYLHGTHLLMLVVDKGGFLRLQTMESGPTGELVKQLSSALGIDLARESPRPRQGRMAKIWLDDTASAQAVSLADFWSGTAGEETCWHAEKTLGVSQITAVRLASPDEPLGIALFLSQGEPREAAMLDAMGRHLSAALANLRKVEKARQFGSIDPVRWIPDRSELMRQLSREVSRAHRYGHPVSLALLVVDNFDTLRLEHGWAAANRLLRSVSSALAGYLRESDFLGSYRHNGFGVILVQTSAEAAVDAAGRLREAAAGVRILEEGGPVPECVIATASSPRDGADADALLVAAESRLLPKRRLSSASA